MPESISKVNFLEGVAKSQFPFKAVVQKREQAQVPVLNELTPSNTLAWQVLVGSTISSGLASMINVWAQ